MIVAHHRQRGLGQWQPFDLSAPGWQPFHLDSSWNPALVSTCPGTALIIGPSGDVPDWQHCPPTKNPTFSVVKSEAPQGWTLLTDPRSVVGSPYYQPQYNPRTDFYNPGQAIPAAYSGNVTPAQAPELAAFIAPSVPKPISYAGSGPQLAPGSAATPSPYGAPTGSDLFSGGRVAVSTPLTPPGQEGFLSSLLNQAKTIPWWVWLLAAGGIYYATRGTKGKNA